jgi:hypothetical protein
MKKAYDTLSEALSDLKLRDYGLDFNLLTDVFTVKRKRSG